MDPAVSADARESQDEWSEAQQLNAGSTLGSSTAQSDNGAAAPGYASTLASGEEDSLKPKGKNIQEGGFDSSAPNASFTTDIGGKNDPGRVALEQFVSAVRSLAIKDFH